MLHSSVRRLTAAVALVLVLAAAPALAAPGHRPHATQAPVAGLSLFDKVLDWLGVPAAASLHGGLQSLFQKSTGTTVSDPGTSGTTQRTTLNRGGMIDPNG
ncbi:MAG TPA: hypothetical protein VLX28_04335 [Thermoanaerobaculia bacterium]|nr:hypothetical protein [Thermoanaerobaculia bacterium]